jgi:hypothetical protein
MSASDSVRKKKLSEREDRGLHRISRKSLIKEDVLAKK